jgi:muramoyltetrapeptide carboxypeptidase
MTRLYVTCPSIAMHNPLDRAASLRRAAFWCEELGWELVPSQLLARYHEPGAWLPAEARAEDIERALEHEVVWACRGGYGAVHLVPRLLELRPEGRTLLIGYSDSTVLHACWRVGGLGPALYGTLSEQIADSRQGMALAALLRGEPFAITGEQEPAGRVLRPGVVRAELFAACLVVLASLCGTPAFPELRGRILAIEDVNERPYSIDFALNQLYLAGKLDGIAGLVGGAFHHEQDAAYGGPTVDEVLRGWAERLDVPALSRVPFGHLDDHLVLPCGVPAELEAHGDGRWRLGWDAGALHIG